MCEQSCQPNTHDLHSKWIPFGQNKQKYSDHISTIVNKASGVLGFIKRWSKEFDDPYLTKTLLISLVRPILEYGSPVWSPQYVVHSDRIESVQKTSYFLPCRA